MIEFIEFLNRKGVLFAFYMNGGFDDIALSKPEHFIGDAFHWDMDPQDEELWYDVEFAWWNEIGYY